jgi:3-oxoadipate CoA-transferase beta subunit
MNKPLKENKVGLSRRAMARRAAQDLPDGAYVNLGIGIPELIAEFIPLGREVIFHSENGVLGFTAVPAGGAVDRDLINAGKKPIATLPGASFFHHADSFSMIRGGHIDYCFLGAMQVASNGDLANWSTGATDAVPAIGGAMDLVAGARTVVVLTEHVTRKNEHKLLHRCTYPLTGISAVSRVITNFGVFDIENGHFVMREIASGVDVEYVRSNTTIDLKIDPSLIVMTNLD